jgi:hypothetical protein
MFIHIANVVELVGDINGSRIAEETLRLVLKRLLSGPSSLFNGGNQGSWKHITFDCSIHSHYYHLLFPISSLTSHIYQDGSCSRFARVGAHKEEHFVHEEEKRKHQANRFD